MPSAPPPDRNKPVPDRFWRQVGRYASLGMVLPTAVFVGLAVGYLLDNWLHTGRVFELVFLVVGMIAGFLQIVRAAMRP